MAAPLAPTPSTRDRILDAALGAFAARGVEATSLDSLAAGVGVRKQTILYWFPSKEQVLLGVVDHAVAELGARLGEAATSAGPSLSEQIAAVVDATFRLGTTDPQLLAFVREVTRVGPPASTQLSSALEPLVAGAAASLARAGGAGGDVDRVRRLLVDAGARVVGMVTEAEVRADLGLAPDVAWLRSRRRSLVESITIALGAR
ncbi:hypothetical protein BH23ACT2_BH23ACT2_29410 [soil metagenome]